MQTEYASSVNNPASTLGGLQVGISPSAIWLLLHRNQIAEVSAAIAQKGLTLVALRLYIKNHVAKVELGLARGKRQYDKRRAIMEREMDMAARQAVRANR